MKGYNITFTRYVGCTTCRNAWHEECRSYVQGSCVINSAQYIYNACDNCYDADKHEYRSGFAPNCSFNSFIPFTSLIKDKT